ncbi:hypothetical protein [Marinimicrobium agarilyticum]|uniref:hypothetical protein n=1 Tax=Marinimicrobium agarilyticum TaxID=306546 RepID=UPI00041A86C1|nr:hypothetical protein [Marinimicrobium agarilyticum]
MISRLLIPAILGTLFLHSTGASALTVEQFSNICDSAPGECSDHPTLQAYVGGALDLIATLDEETKYLDTLYCRDPQTLFDVPTIIRFMQEHREGYTERNAMLLVVRYFEANGGCQSDE